MSPGVGDGKHHRHLRVELSVAMLLEVMSCVEIEPVFACGEPALGKLPDTAVTVGGASADD